MAAYPSPALLRPSGAGWSLGRAELAAVGIHDGEVSRRHARIVRGNQTSLLEDCSARNGTWIGGRRLAPGTRATLREGDIVRLGRTLLVFREDVPLEAVPVAPLVVRGDRGPRARAFVGPWLAARIGAVLQRLVAHPPAQVLILGATGTGKELLARLIHERVSPKGAPWIAVNAATLTPELAASQLFGHTPGAFTGAVRASEGLLRAAHGGTLFLDEVCDLPLAVQPMLLRVLQERIVTPVGGYREVPVDVRILAAGHDDLDKRVDEGKFRRDLFERLREATIELPPLRERPEDLWAIARAALPVLEHIAVEVEAVERLLLAGHPGNVRQLQGEIASALRVDPSALRVSALPSSVAEPPPGLALGGERTSLGGAREHRPVSKEEARALVARSGGIAAAARATGMPPTSLRRLLGKS